MTLGKSQLDVEYQISRKESSTTTQPRHVLDRNQIIKLDREMFPDEEIIPRPNTLLHVIINITVLPSFPYHYYHHHHHHLLLDYPLYPEDK